MLIHSAPSERYDESGTSATQVAAQLKPLMKDEIHPPRPLQEHVALAASVVEGTHHNVASSSP